MQTPEFWHRPDSWAAQALRPAAAIYGAVARFRLRSTVAARASLPVICVGNITAGGSGKTPVAMAVARRLADMGERPAFLTRGYGGRLAGPLVVDAATAHAVDVGDEPLLLARHFPTVKSANRPLGADLAAQTGASVVVMDDGFQNPSLHKDAGLVVIDAATGLGNGFTLPAGPMRETAEDALARAHAVIVMGDAPACASTQHVMDLATAKDLPIIKGRLTPQVDPDAWRGKPVLAYAGIGRPEKFFGTVASLGADLRQREVFADHHAFTDDEAQALLSRARADGLTLVTTDKDMARLTGAGHSGALAELRDQSQTVPVAVAFDDPAALDQLLRARMNAATQAGDYKAF